MIASCESLGLFDFTQNLHFAKLGAGVEAPIVLGLGLLLWKPPYRGSGFMVESGRGERAEMMEWAHRWGVERPPLSLAVRPLCTYAVYCSPTQHESAAALCRRVLSGGWLGKPVESWQPPPDQDVA